MIKKIDNNNPIFNILEFQKDKYKFYIGLKIILDNNSVIYSNENDYVIMQSDESNPIWIWTKDEIDLNSSVEIMNTISKYYNKNCKITCKKEFYDLLLKKYKDIIDTDRYFEMGILYCDNTKKTRECDGNMELAEMSNIDVIAKYWYDDNLETEDKNMTLEKARLDAIDMIKSGNTYVLKNKVGKIVCMASYNEINDIAKINHVYTPVEERKKGYCTKLIYELTNMLLKKGIVPMLYTDYNYIPSNKSYMNAGYINDGVLVSFYLKGEDK